LNGQVEEVVEDAGEVSASDGAVFAADDVSDPADCFAVVGADSLRPSGSVRVWVATSARECRSSVGGFQPT